jgi:hypothetical protein
MSDDTNSDLGTSELDWTHINETILMIGLAVAQIEKTLNDGDDSISVLTGSFISMMACIGSINNEVNEIISQKEADKIMTEAREIMGRIKEADSSLTEDADRMEDLISIMGSGILSGARDRATNAADEANVMIQDTIIAFQFYDRLSQRLHQIVSSLGMMSQLFADKQRLHNPYEWAELQDSIKARYTIDADRIMFDALLAGASIEDAVDIATEYETEEETPETEIELF